MPTHVPNTVLFNKHLEPPHNKATVPDSRGGLISGETLIAQNNGWDWAPSEAEPPPGEQARAVEFRPVVPAASEPDPSTLDYDARTVPQLQDELRDRGLPTTGNKGELIDRLTADDESDDEAQEG
jgi:hypothetical protein